MKILFVMLHPGYVRNYESTIRLLAERDYHIHLCFNQPEKQSEDRQTEAISKDNPNITFSTKPVPKRTYFWRSLSKAIYGGRDYLRYLHPRYANAPKLRERVEDRIGGFNVFFKYFRFFTGVMGYKIIDRLLKIMDKALSSDRNIEDFIKSHKPDLILVTPLVNIASDQTEIFKSAKALGIKCGLCVASWDNLTNKGLIRGEPDIVIVWNEIQKREAIELHGILSDKVVVTGAHCYDKWFERRPSTSKEAFCAKVGINKERPFLLYLCSSPFIAPYEVGFVEEWINQIRDSDDESLRGIGLLVRPHPQNAKQWRDVDFSRWENVAIWPRAGANPVTEESKSDFYDSMYHSIAVVGINSSSMIEAGILNKPVYTIKEPRFKGTQEGTLHFHYLLKGGLLQIGSNFKEHLQQVIEMLNGGADKHKEKIRSFIKDFVRPYGLDVPCTPIIVNAIEELAKSRPVYPKPTPIWVPVVKAMLVPRAFFMQYPGKRKIKKSKNSKKSKTKNMGMVYGSLKICLEVSWFLIKLLRLDSPIKKYIIPLLSERLESVPTNKMDKDPVEDCKKELMGIAKDSKPIIIGPWLSEVGFEVLYWIPFVNWAVEAFGLYKERIVVVSRGGAEPWYEGIFDKYIDVFDYFSKEEFKTKNLNRITSSGTQKHNTISEFDREIIDFTKDSLKIDEFNWLHPSLMYSLFKYFWRRKSPISLIDNHTIYKRYQPLAQEEVAEYLPGDYIAVKFYFSEAFPDTAENRLFISDILNALTRETNVVLLNTGLNIDDHGESSNEKRERILTLEDNMNPRNNLSIQTYVISKARAFFGTYGGFSYLAPFYGVPSVAFYSREDKFLPVHLDVAYRASRVLKFGEFDKVKSKGDSFINIGDKPEFIALNVCNMDVLKILFNEENLNDFAARRVV